MLWSLLFNPIRFNSIDLVVGVVIIDVDISSCQELKKTSSKLNRFRSDYHCCNNCSLWIESCFIVIVVLIDSMVALRFWLIFIHGYDRLDFKDVLIRPKRSTLKSRSQVSYQLFIFIVFSHIIIIILIHRWRLKRLISFATVVWHGLAFLSWLPTWTQWVFQSDVRVIDLY